MFKKLFKSLKDNVEDLSKDLINDHLHATTNKTQQPHEFQGGIDMQKVFENGAASVGMKTPGSFTEDPNDPTLQPVHGITLFDYAAGASKIGEGCSPNQVCERLGIERPIWDEAKTIWNNRMRDDRTYNVVNVYTHYFGKVKEHPILADLVPDQAPATDVPEGVAKENLARLASDKHYFFEIQGALEAAYANGIDGAQWLIDELGLTVSQVNGAGTQYMNDFNTIAQMMDYQEQKKAEYGQQFAKQNGTSGIADDIEF